MLPVFWLESADADLAAITEYIGLRDVDAAFRMWDRLRTSVLPLSEHPYLYRVTADRVEVVNVVHARREYPSSTL